MSLGIEQLIKNEKMLMSDRGVLLGVVGSIAGAYVGQKMRLGVPGTAGGIATGHFAGHSLAEATK